MKNSILPLAREVQAEDLLDGCRRQRRRLRVDTMEFLDSQTLPKG
jgi:hypothetical protein